MAKTYDAGVKEYRETYWMQEYTPKDTDLLACFKVVPQEGVPREEVAAAVAADQTDLFNHHVINAPIITLAIQFVVDRYFHALGDDQGVYNGLLSLAFTDGQRRLETGFRDLCRSYPRTAQQSGRTDHPSPPAP